jgi:hypothetical protein
VRTRCLESLITSRLGSHLSDWYSALACAFDVANGALFKEGLNLAQGKRDRRCK